MAGIVDRKCQFPNTGLQLSFSLFSRFSPSLFSLFSLSFSLFSLSFLSPYSLLFLSFSLSLFLSFFLSPFVIFGHLLESRRQAPQMKSSVAFITHNRLFGIGFQPAFRASDKRYEREKEIGMNRPDLWPNACACSLPISLDAS